MRAILAVQDYGKLRQPVAASTISTIRDIGDNALPGMEASLQQRKRQLVDQLLLDHTPQRPRAVGGVIAHVPQQLARGRGDLELHTALGHALDHACQLQVRRSLRSARARAGRSARCHRAG